LVPWRLWRSGLGRNGFARAASLDSARTRSQGLRGLKKTVTLCGKPCRNLVYKGFFKVPQEWLDLAKENKKKRKKKKTVATMESQDANSSDRSPLATAPTNIASLQAQIQLIQALLDSQPSVARIQEIMSEKDFSVGNL
jgi:hypothetical protein